MLVVQRWILARLRHHRCFSLAEVNQCIAGLLEDLNNRPFKQLPGSRRSTFEALDKPALKPLPRHPYRYVAIKPVTVNIDYHVQYRHHYYSVPHQYVGEKLDLHAGETLVELYFRQQRVATHPRQDRPGFTTNPAHMPTRHRAQHQWSPRAPAALGQGDGTGGGHVGEPATRAPRPPGTGLPRLSGSVVTSANATPPAASMAPVVSPTRPDWCASSTSDTSWRTTGTNCPIHPIRPPSCPRTTRTSVAGITSTEGDHHDHSNYLRTPA